MRWPAGLAALVLALPAAAETASRGDGAVAWLRNRTGHALDVQAIGPVAIAPGGVIVVDPLTYSTGYDWPFLAVPEGQAQFLVALDAESGRVSKAALVFSDAPVACGHDEATVGVDTGLAAFLDRPAAAALEADSQALGPGRDIYNDWFDALIGETHVVKEMVPLPSGTRFPMMSSGWGDGGYPVASLSDAEGRMVAIYVDFMGMNEDGDWLLPPECPAPKVVRLEMPAFPPFNPAASRVW